MIVALKRAMSASTSCKVYGCDCCGGFIPDPGEARSSGCCGIIWCGFGLAKASLAFSVSGLLEWMSFCMISRR